MPWDALIVFDHYTFHIYPYLSLVSYQSIFKSISPAYLVSV